MSSMFRGTTIVAVKRDGRCAVAGDGQVTMNKETIMKGTVKKVRRIYNDKIVAGFAGGVADAFTLIQRFEEKLEQCGGSLMRSAVELAKDWRSDKHLKDLEALLIVTDGKDLLIISGNGDVIDPDDGVAAIGSGGNYALAAARALVQNTDMSALDIAKRAINIAGEICIFTNTNITAEEVVGDE